jgi:hypothetical protein
MVSMNETARKVATRGKLTPRAALLTKYRLLEEALKKEGFGVRLFPDIPGTRKIEQSLNAFAELRRWLMIMPEQQGGVSEFFEREAERVAGLCKKLEDIDEPNYGAELAGVVEAVVGLVTRADFDKRDELLATVKDWHFFAFLEDWETSIGASIVPAYTGDGREDRQSTVNLPSGTMSDAEHDLNALAAKLGLSFEEAAATLTEAAKSRDDPLRRARRVVREFERHPELPETPEVVAARSLVNRANYQSGPRRKAKTPAM